MIIYNDTRNNSSIKTLVIPRFVGTAGWTASS